RWRSEQPTIPAPAAKRASSAPPGEVSVAMRRSGGAGSRTVAMAGLSRRCWMWHARVTCTGLWVTVLGDLAPQTSGTGLLRAGRARDGLPRRRAVERRPRALRGAHRRVRRLHRLRRAVPGDDRRARRPPARRAGPGDGRRAAAGLPRLVAGPRPRDDEHAGPRRPRRLTLRAHHRRGVAR